MRATLLALAACLLAACTSTATSPPTASPTGRRPPPTEAPFKLSDLAKSDIDAVAEVHLRESIASAKLLMEKLYRRNPRELRKSDLPTPEAGVARAFDPRNAWRFAEGDVFLKKITYYWEKLSFLEKSKEKLGKAT